MLDGGFAILSGSTGRDRDATWIGLDLSGSVFVGDGGTGGKGVDLTPRDGSASDRRLASHYQRPCSHGGGGMGKQVVEAPSFGAAKVGMADDVRPGCGRIPGGYFSAVDRTLVSTATMLTVCTAPLVVAILARTLLKEQLGAPTLVALTAGLAGTVLLIGGDGLAGLTDPRLTTGNALALFAAFCYGGYTLIGKHLLADAPPFRVLAVAFSLGALLLSPVIRLPDPSLEAWLLLCYLGAVPTAAAYLFYMHGLRRSTATRASVAALLGPDAALLALIFLGERLPPAGWWEPDSSFLPGLDANEVQIQVGVRGNRGKALFKIRGLQEITKSGILPFGPDRSSRVIPSPQEESGTSQTVIN